MARVIPIDNFQVEPRGAGGQSFDAPSTAGIDSGARQALQTGEALMQAGQAQADIVIDAQREANQIRVLEAENEAREEALRLAYDPQEGYTQAKGRDVMERPSGKPLADEYGERYQSAIANISGKLSNDWQRRAFQIRAGQLSASFGAQAMRYEAEEYRGYQMSVVSGSADLSAQSIAAAGGNVDVIDGELQRLDASVAALGKLRGQSGNEITALQNVARSKALGTAIGAAMQRDDITTASSLFERYNDRLVAEDRIAVEGPLNREREGRLALGIADEVMSGMTSSATEIGLPVTGGKVTSPFGAARDTGGHNGVDIAVPIGTPVRATISGVVKQWRDARGGVSLAIVGDDGTRVGLAHLSEYRSAPGQRVAKGDVVALSGNTGRSTGPHVHYTLTSGGQKVDPLATGRATTKRATLEDALAAARARLPENASLRLIRSVEQEVETRWRVRKLAKDERDEVAMTQVYQALIQNGGNIGGLSPGLRTAIPADKYDSVIGFARTLLTPAPRDPRRDDALYNDAVSDPAALRSMPDSAFLAKYAGHPSFNALATYRAELRGNGKKPSSEGSLNREAISRTVNDRLSSYGFDLTPKDEDDRARLGSIRRVVDGAVAAEQARRGRAMTDVETQEFVDRMLLRSQTLEGYWGSKREVPAVGITPGQINTTDRKKIEDALRRRNMPVTDANILEVYLSNKLR